MQRVFRSQLVERSTDYAERIRALEDSGVGGTPAAVLDGLAAAGARALERLRHAVRPERLEEAVALLAAAEAIHVVGQRRAFAVAAYLGYAFGQLGRRTHLLDGVGGTTLQQADFITPRDVLVVVSFAPYGPETLAVAHRADERGVPIVALTDGPLSPLIPLARVAFEVDDADLQGFRSLSATMCLALALVVSLGQAFKTRPGKEDGARSSGRSARRAKPRLPALAGAARGPEAREPGFELDTSD
jgi:DNA-binding MurR/RpiR family transcriptional regulator